MAEMIAVEQGSMGRVAYARIAPNEDLVQGVEKVCLAEGFRNAFVRGALGSLVDACLGTIDGKYLQIKGPAVEIVSLAGEVRSSEDGSLRAALTGVVADPRGQRLRRTLHRRIEPDLHDVRGHPRGVASRQSERMCIGRPIAPETRVKWRKVNG